MMAIEEVNTKEDSNDNIIEVPRDVIAKIPRVRIELIDANSDLES